MNKKEIVEKFYETTEATYYRHKKQNRPVIEFIEKYFTDADLEEFLATGSLQRLENKEDNYLSFMFIDYVKYNQKEKIELLNSLIAKDALLNILEALNNNPEIEINNYKSKDYLIRHIESSKLSNKKELVKTINSNFSHIECYVLIKYSKEFLEEK